MTRLKPVALMVASARWIPTARLGIALDNAGFSVAAVCPPRHPLGLISTPRRIYTYRSLSPLRSISAAIAASTPDILIPCDDLAARELYELYERERHRGNSEGTICKLIERSVGSAPSFPIVHERASFIQLAESEGVRVPKTESIATQAALESWSSWARFPAVLKANGTSGGEGVRIAQNPVEALKAYQRLQAPAQFARAAKRALFDGDKTLIWPSLLRARYTVNAQEFIKGREATSLIACWKGTVLAGLHFEVIHKLNASGPATVLQFSKNPEMPEATAKMVRRLCLSGLHGFDFMIEESTEHAYMIEINPRTTQVGHLALGPGKDLPAALYAAVSGEPIRTGSKITENDKIALFPGEWMRNPASNYLQSAYHDVPWDEPALIRVGVKNQRKQNSWYSPKKLTRAISVVGISSL